MLPIPVPIESELFLPCLSVDEISLGMINLAPPSHLFVYTPTKLPSLISIHLHFPSLYLQNYNQDHMHILPIVHNVLREQFPKEYPYLVQFLVVSTFHKMAFTFIRPLSGSLITSYFENPFFPIPFIAFYT